MEWLIERNQLSLLQPTFSRNSPLKKKMLYVRKLKNLDNNKDLISELLVENMEQFYTEIISSLLSNRPNTSEDIKNVVRVLCVYLKDEKFVSLLFNSIIAAVPECVQTVGTYWHLVVYLESRCIINPKFDVMPFFKEFYGKSNLEVKILLLEYLMDFTDALEAREIIERERKIIKMYSIIENNEEIDSYGIERIREACKKLNIVFNGDKKNDNEFKAIITPEENEFDWYIIKNEKVEPFTGSLTAKDLVEFIKINFNNSRKLDSLCRTLKHSDNIRLVPQLLNKFKGNVCYFPALARIIKSLGGAGKKIISRIIEDLNGTRKGRVSKDCRSDQINNLILLSELIKFRSVPPNEVFALLDHFLKTKDTELYCLLLKNIGRFYLLDENTNCRAREYLDKAINLGNRSNNLECLYINDMVSRVFPSRKETGWSDFLYFFAYFTQQETFKEDSEAWKVLNRNRKFLFMLFLRPWDFKDLTYIAYLIDKVHLIDSVIDFILVLFTALNKDSKMKTIAFAQLLGKVIKYKKNVVQEEIIKTILEMNLEINLKVRMVLWVIVDVNIYIKQKFLYPLRKLSRMSTDRGTHALIFNLCEEIGEKSEELGDDDSFEEEIRYLNGV